MKGDRKKMDKYQSKAKAIISAWDHHTDIRVKNLRRFKYYIANVFVWFALVYLGWVLSRLW